MAASHDVSNAATSKSAGTTLSLSHTSAANAVLGIVMAVAHEGEGAPVSATWGGVAMTQVLSQTRAKMWIIGNPATGAQTVEVTYAADGDIRGMASMSLIGASPANSFRATDTGYMLAGGTLQNSLADSISGDIVVAGVGISTSAASPAPTYSHTEGEAIRAQASSSGGNTNIRCGIGEKAAPGGATNSGINSGGTKHLLNLVIKYRAGNTQPIVIS